MFLKVCLSCSFHQIVPHAMPFGPCQCGQVVQYFDSPERLHILHADLDAFFAAVEILDNPSLRGKPVIVGGHPKSRGVVATCSYEARRFGIHSAMPLYKVQELCPQAVFLPVRMERYAELSRHVFAIFESFTPDMEPLSIDEAFLDMKGTEALWGHPVLAAIKLKQKVKVETGLTVSVGVAPNKFLAKLASSTKKPDGLYVVTQDSALSFLDPMPIENMMGVGKRSLPLFQNRGIHKIGDLRKYSLKTLVDWFGIQGAQVFELCQGHDTRILDTARETKSIGNETTLNENLTHKEQMIPILWELCEKVSRRLYHQGLLAKTVTLKLKTQQFQLWTRSTTLSKPIWIDLDIFENLKQLLYKVELNGKQIRLLGVSLSHFENPKPDPQLSLFSEPTNHLKKEKLSQAIQTLKDRLGNKAITRLVK